MENPVGLSAAVAIQAALAAEEEAMQIVATHRAQAEEILDAARRQASEILAHADTRVSTLHKASNKRIRKRAESIPEATQPDLATTPAAEAALHSAVNQLAAWLTGQSDTLTPPRVPAP
ncbi:MAG: hypothetical protein H7835_07260 [Magnetococcus sp. XQGC-1]